MKRLSGQIRLAARNGRLGDAEIRGEGTGQGRRTGGRVCRQREDAPVGKSNAVSHGEVLRVAADRDTLHQIADLIFRQCAAGQHTAQGRVAHRCIGVQCELGAVAKPNNITAGQCRPKRIHCQRRGPTGVAGGIIDLGRLCCGSRTHRQAGRRGDVKRAGFVAGFVVRQRGSRQCPVQRRGPSGGVCTEYEFASVFEVN